MNYAIIENGTVVNIAEADEAFAAAQGWILTDTAQIGWAYDGEIFTPPAPKPITPAQVIAERSRRLALGFDYDFADTRGVHRIGTTPDDMRGWDEVTTWASAAIALGNGSSTLTVVTDTGPVTVTALEWQSILAAATAFRQPIWGASFALQAMEPIPQDYASDQHWP